MIKIAHLTISVADWVVNEAINKKIKNKSARFEELMIKGLMFEQQNEQKVQQNKSELMEYLTPNPVFKDCILSKSY